jgi:hypothetical protein
VGHSRKLVFRGELHFDEKVLDKGTHIEAVIVASVVTNYYPNI